MKDWTNVRNGRLVGIKELPKHLHYRRWLFRCDCGNEVSVLLCNLSRTQSCGCLAKEMLSKRRRQNIAGRRYGRLVAVEPVKRSDNRSMLWKCLCDCGNITIVSVQRLNSGNTKSCGCLQHSLKIKDRIGKRYGKLTAIRQLTDSGDIVWECLCDCGKTKNILSSWLSSGTKSCGCAKQDAGRAFQRDVSGQRFGMLTALRPTKRRDVNQGMVWEWKCDCGNIINMSLNSVTRGNTQSCGCKVAGVKYIYCFISKKTGLVKYGVSCNVLKRKYALESELDESLECIYHRPATFEEETKLHQDLKKYRTKHPNNPTRREWYAGCSEVLDYLDILKETT